MNQITAPALHIQAATRLLAIIMLLVIMNWFFHNVYGARWIMHHNQRKRELPNPQAHEAGALWGLYYWDLVLSTVQGLKLCCFCNTSV